MRFVNPHQKKLNRGFIHFFLWFIGYYKDCPSLPPIPPTFTYPNSKENSDPSKPCVTWVNHHTFWIQAQGKSLLFDPIWNSRCSPLPLLGPKRVHAPPFPLEMIKSLDVVVISHNHYDHLDKFTVQKLHKLYPNTLWVVAKGIKPWFIRYCPGARVKELEWWEELSDLGLKLTAVPAQHFSGRGLFDRNGSQWMGCVIDMEGGKRVYFAGDTGYNPFDFKEIGERFPKIDLSLLPIGVYLPRLFMKPVHINPIESLRIHQEVGSSLSVAGHWGTFRLASEEMERPPFDLFHAMQETQTAVETFRVLNPGQTINW